MDKKKLKYNTILILINQIVAVMVGLIVPRMLLNTYGSMVNGYVYSISQMLSVITYFDFGISAVAQAAMYKPLVEKNEYQISIIYQAVKRYFRILGGFLIIYIGVLCVYYSSSYSDKFSEAYTVGLVLSISFGMIGQYVSGITDQVLLAADQKIYIYTFVNLVTLLLNAGITYIGIINNFSIQGVKLMASCIFLIKPVILRIIVSNNYRIKKIKNIPKDAIPQKWNGLIQHIASTLTLSLDTIVLTFLSTLQNVSIYNIYVFPLNGLQTLVTGIGGGYKSFFGQALVSDNKKYINYEFRKYEYLFHVFSIIVGGVSLSMIVPFVLLYTSGVNDADYENYPFAILIVLAYSIVILRSPYTTLINAAGHFKQTQKHCLIEVMLNIILSFSLVKMCGITGVAIGTLVSVTYRLIVSVSYLRVNIINRGFKKFTRQILIDSLIWIIYILITGVIRLNAESLFKWISCAIIYTLILLSIVFIITFVFERKLAFAFINKIRSVKG